MKHKCPHCGHELEIKFNATKTTNYNMIPVAASTRIGQYKGPLIATAIGIASIGLYIIGM
jgi:phage terminase large subunit GpA-like protein